MHQCVLLITNGERPVYQIQFKNKKAGLYLQFTVVELFVQAAPGHLDGIKDAFRLCWLVRAGEDRRCSRNDIA